MRATWLGHIVRKRGLTVNDLDNNMLIYDLIQDTKINVQHHIHSMPPHKAASINHYFLAWLEATAYT
ncbi:hypothetical protein CDV31_007804 [Fusarium ambrosium]|uniref:Uncharacterized protein n=1 Tax=Fusarium ambrosium TaxID=131363 RepID=A0A428U4N0_9HYPO|nr:hypothetical protein CDV31_007804 [Fusarium ambrosium]